MKKKKKILIWIVAVAVICTGGYFVGERVIVDYIFDRIVLKNTLSMLENTEIPASSQSESEATETPAPETAGEEEPVQSATPTEKPVQKPKKSVDEMTTSEVASVVSKTPELIAKLEAIVSHSDKQRVMNILISNFTKEEIAKYSAKVAGGMTSEVRSELVGIARSRLTSAQWSECLNIFSKYVNQLKPYME